MPLYLRLVLEHEGDSAIIRAAQRTHDRAGHAPRAVYVAQTGELAVLVNIVVLSGYHGTIVVTPLAPSTRVQNKDIAASVK